MSFSKQWHEERKAYVGASEVPAILGASKYSSPWEVWAIKQGIRQPFGGNDATRLGNDIEPVILDQAERELGMMKRQVVHSVPSGLMRATCDGQLLETGQLVEAKTAGLATRGSLDDWGDEGQVVNTGDVPLSYYVQVQAQLRCSGEDIAHLYALIAGRGYCRFVISADTEFGEYIETKVEQWWQRHMVDGIEPDLEGTSIDVLKAIDREPGSEVELDADLADLVDARAAFVKARTKLNKDIDACTGKIIAALGKAEVGILPDGRRVEYKSQSRDAYTVEASSYRVLRLKK